MNTWIVQDDGFDSSRITGDGNKYLVGNGYMGVRGTPEEFGKGEYAAVNLAGIYDRVGDGWREPLNAPNGFFTEAEMSKEVCSLVKTKAESHSICLDIKRAVYSRNTRFGNAEIKSERFASMADCHLLALRYTVTARKSGELTVRTGIDADVWDINGPHYDGVCFDKNENGTLTATATTHESGDRVFVAECCKYDFATENTVPENRSALREITVGVMAKESFVIDKFIAVYTSKDEGGMEAAVSLAERAAKKGYEAVRAEHEQSWSEIWNSAAVVIDGDDEAMRALNYSIYHLNCIAPRHSQSLSIPARGLSGQTYKGAIFWDTEMFILDLFLYTNPKVAKTLLKYRVDTLEGARKKARSYGYDGAFYAWESQEGGYDACSDYNVTDVFTGRPMRTYFKDKQIHISAAIAYGILRYTAVTGDRSLLNEGGAVTVTECANFYYGLLLKRAAGEAYELHDVIGPDEYHERVNNNGYTNRMAKLTIDSALDILKNLDTLSETERDEIKKRFDVGLLIRRFSDASAKLYIPKPDEKSGVIEQFDGYFKLEDVSVDTVRSRLLNDKEYWGGAYGVASDTQVIKQADVVTWLTLFPDDYSDEIKLKNWQYYEPRTEHGSSLSACMYALLACRCGMPEKAYPLFMKSASADLKGGGKEWAGLVYIGGTHPAAAGGAYMTVINGFCGLRIEQGKPVLYPRFPKGWKSVEFKLCCNGGRYSAKASQDGWSVEEIKGQQG